LSARAFAKRVNVGTSFLRNVMLGAKPVPENRIEPWAEALELAGEDRERFVDEAWLSHCPRAREDAGGKAAEAIALLDRAIRLPHAGAWQSGWA
jgi:hypothetical protein